MHLINEDSEQSEACSRVAAVSYVGDGCASGARVGLDAQTLVAVGDGVARDDDAGHSCVARDRALTVKRDG